MKKGFTLIELLAVIAILAILVIIALPNVLKLFNTAKKDTFLTEVRNLYNSVQQEYLSSSITGNATTAFCTSNTLTSETSSTLSMQGESIYYNIILDSTGKISNMYVSSKDGNYAFSGSAGLKIEDIVSGTILEKGNTTQTSLYEAAVANSKKLCTAS